LPEVTFCITEPFVVTIRVGKEKEELGVFSFKRSQFRLNNDLIQFSLYASNFLYNIDAVCRQNCEEVLNKEYLLPVEFILQQWWSEYDFYSLARGERDTGDISLAYLHYLIRTLSPEEYVERLILAYKEGEKKKREQKYPFHNEYTRDIPFPHFKCVLNTTKYLSLYRFHIRGDTPLEVFLPVLKKYGYIDL